MNLVSRVSVFTKTGQTRLAEAMADWGHHRQPRSGRLGHNEP